MTESGFARVDRHNPCPVCGRPDWCLIARDGAAAICARVESATLIKRPGKDAAGWLHRLQDPLPERPARTKRHRPAPDRDFGALAGHYVDAVNPGALREFAHRLGVSVESLRRLWVGWDGEAWTFPMRDAAGMVTGVRRRLLTGRKLSVRGGHEGVFVPDNLSTDGLMVVAEGPTDTAALLTVGFEAVGRPNCRGGTDHLKPLCDRRAVVIVADADVDGRSGANDLAGVLTRHCPEVRVVLPPDGVNDVRQWVRRGATHDDVHAAIDHAQIIQQPRVIMEPLTRQHRWYAPARNTA